MARRKQTRPTKCENEENQAEKSSSPEPPAKMSRIETPPTVPQFDARINKFPLPDPKLMVPFGGIIGKAPGPPPIPQQAAPSHPSLTAAQVAQLLIMARQNNWNDSLVLKMAGIDMDLMNEQKTPDAKKQSRSRTAPSPIQLNNGKLVGNMPMSHSAVSTSSSVVVSSPAAPLGDLVRDQRPSTSAANPLMALEKTMARFQPAQKGSVPPSPAVSLPSASQSPTFSGGLGSLYQFVGQLPNRLDSRGGNEDASAILTCLQCGRGYGSMDQLVHHMQQTKHFDNLPKPYSNGINGWANGLTATSPSPKPQAFPNGKSPSTNGTTPKKDESNSQKLDFNTMVVNLQARIKLTYPDMKLACARCSAESENIDMHLRTVHNVTNYNDWVKSVRMVRNGNTDRASISPRSTEAILSKWSSSLAAPNVNATPPPATTPRATPPVVSKAAPTPTAPSLAAFAQLNPFAIMAQLGMTSLIPGSQSKSQFPDATSPHLDKMISLINSVNNQKK